MKKNNYAKKFILFLMIFLTGYWLPANAWNETGHRVIAIIAYQQLTDQAKQKVDNLTYKMFPIGNGYQRFLEAAVWPDEIKKENINLFSNWHYINLPWKTPSYRYKTYPPARTNLETVLNQSIKILNNPHSNLNLRIFILAMLIHLEGDAHQPLHCINRFGYGFPHGDGGGNWFYLNRASAKNLHAFWDQGLGLFEPSYLNHTQYNFYIDQLAKRFSNQYPKQFFYRKVNDLYPSDWIKESYHLAILCVYSPLKKNRFGNYQKFQVLSKNYIVNGQQCVEKQTVLAGYRLGSLLNKLFGG